MGICPAVTRAVVVEATQTQLATEYVTVPAPVTKFVISTVPLTKTLVVTAVSVSTALAPRQTGYCTTTRVIFTSSALNQARVLTHTKKVVETVTSDFFSTVTAATWVPVTETVSTTYDIWTKTVQPLAQEVVVSTSELIWNPVTVTTTMTKHKHKTVYEPCGY